MKRYLYSGVFIVLGILTAALLAIVWILGRPRFEADAIARQMAVEQRMQTLVTQNLDRVIADWSGDARIIARQVALHPREGESILHVMTVLRPDIMEIRVHSASLSDELYCQNTAFAPITLQIPESSWLHARQDSVLRIALLKRSDAPALVFAEQMQIQLEDAPFSLTIVRDARRLSDIFSALSYDRSEAVCLQGSSGIIMRRGSFSEFRQSPSDTDTSVIVQAVLESGAQWHMITRPLPSSPFWFTTAFPEKNITQPIEELLQDVTIVILSLMLLLSFLGWILVLRIRQMSVEHAAVPEEQPAP